MEKFVNNIILEKIDDIIDLIKESKEYQDYHFLFDKLDKNEQANLLIKEVKELQKQIVKKEVLKDSTFELENKLNYLLEQLNKIPLYVEFVEKQEKLNEKYQSVKQKLDNYFYDILN